MINLSVPVQLSPCSEIGRPFSNIVKIIIKTLNFNGLGNSPRIDKSKTEMTLESFNSISMWRVLTFPVVDMLREVASISYVLLIVIS